MDSLSLFQSMQGNVNPMGAYAAGSKLANDMLAIQSQQAQQVFQNLYNSAQQAENRRQFEQTLAFKQQELQDQSARGWFNAETQRMAYDPNRGRAEGPPITAMQPQVTDLGSGLLSVRKATKDGFQDQIFQTKESSSNRGLPPAGIITVNQAQQQPMPAGIPNTPNPPFDSGERGQFAAPPTDMGPSEYPFDNSGTYREDWAAASEGQQIPLTPIQPIPPAAEVIPPRQMGQPAPIEQPSMPRQMGQPSSTQPSVSVIENAPQRSTDSWPSADQPPEVIHDGFGSLTKKGRGLQGEKTIQYGTINEKGQMRWLGEPESVQSEIVPKVVTVKGITFAQTGKNSWSIYKPDGEKQGLSDAGQMMALEKIYEEKKEIAKNESNLAEEDAAIKATLATNDDATVKAKSAAFKAEIGHLPKSPADWDYASKAYERSLKSQRYEEYNRLLEVSREKVDRLEGLLLPGATELQSPQSGPATTTGNTTSVGRDYLNRVKK
jgi:hypothetical protein